MTHLENGIKEALVEYGAMNDNWRMKITDKEIIAYSDWAKVEIEIYKPRCRKPCIIWTLAINMVKELVDFERSTFVRL